MEKKYMLFSLNFAHEATILLTLKGNNFYKTYNLATFVTDNKHMHIITFFCKNFGDCVIHVVKTLINFFKIFFTKFVFFSPYGHFVWSFIFPTPHIFWNLHDSFTFCQSVMRCLKSCSEMPCFRASPTHKIATLSQEI